MKKLEGVEKNALNLKKGESRMKIGRMDEMVEIIAKDIRRVLLIRDLKPFPFFTQWKRESGVIT